MKKKLLGCTALAGAVLAASAAQAAEAPTWKLTGNANFQAYWVDQHDLWETTEGFVEWANVLEPSIPEHVTTFPWTSIINTEGVEVQAHDWYFGVDEAELQLDVSGTADNGLNYGFKIEINANTTDGTVADEVRLQLSGGWGTLQMGDEDGAEDIMNYGGENLMGGTGGFDGDHDDYLLRIHLQGPDWAILTGPPITGDAAPPIGVALPAGFILGAPSYPTIAGDTSDNTKISYFSPRLAGFQLGASITPTPSNGDEFKRDGLWEDHIGVGANYDNSFGDVRIRASAVYSRASSNSYVAPPSWCNLPENAGKCTTVPEDVYGSFGVASSEDISAWSVGGIVGWGSFSLGANYTDNGDSGAPIGKWLTLVDTPPYATNWKSSYWNVALGYETGPVYLSAGYFESTKDWGFLGERGFILPGGTGGPKESVYKHLALTADYTLAAGIGVYAEVNYITDENNMKSLDVDSGLQTLDTTSVVVGANVSF